MKLLYVCADRATDPLHWSGTVFNCCKALKSAGAEVEVFDQIPFECPWGLRLLHQGYKRFGKRTHYLQVEPEILRRAAARIAKAFLASDADAIFCPGTGVPVYGYISPEVPVFSYLDATKYTWIESYLGINTLSARSLRQVIDLDQVALTNNTMTIFSSPWAVAEAVRINSIDPKKLAVVPFGANLASTPSAADVASWIEERQHHPIRLLFLGKEWERKGGPEALSLVREIRNLGLNVTLEIVGCVPKLTPAELDLCNLHGFIDHSSAAGQVELRQLLRQASLLIFLSKAEAFGIALCEAAAFGIPAFASPVGGVPSVVLDAESGLLAELPFNASQSASILVDLLRDRSRYRAMARAVHHEYESRLNWEVAGRSLLRCIEEKLGD